MNLAKVLKSCVKNHAFFYVTLDPERALGLEDVMPNYTIICPFKSQLTDKLKRLPYNYDRSQMATVAVLEEHLSEGTVKKIGKRGTYGILQSDFVREYIRRVCGKDHVGYRKPHIVVLKNSQLIEDFCKKQNWQLLAPMAKVAEQFENKISQYRLLRNTAPYPNSFISTVRGAYSASPPFVLQFNRGHSGNSTFFIKTKKGLSKLRKLYPNRECKISEFIKGKTYTLNCLALKNGKVLTGSISEQITGLNTATNNPNTTCGNDFHSPKKLPKSAIEKIAKIAQKIGGTLYRNKYRGLFGIDVIIENSTRKVYCIELNTHQPASISFEAKLHRAIGKVPLMAYFILDSAGTGIQPKKADMPPTLLPISAKQIMYRNKSKKILSREYIAKKYKDMGLLARVKFVKPNEEIYRTQQLNNRAIEQ